MDPHEFGRKAEDAAAAYLERKGKRVPKLWVLAVLTMLTMSYVFICIRRLLDPFGT